MIARRPPGVAADATLDSAGAIVANIGPPYDHRPAGAGVGVQRRVYRHTKSRLSGQATLPSRGAQSPRGSGRRSPQPVRTASGAVGLLIAIAAAPVAPC